MDFVKEGKVGDNPNFRSLLWLTCGVIVCARAGEREQRSPASFEADVRMLALRSDTANWTVLPPGEFAGAPQRFGKAIRGESWRCIIALLFNSVKEGNFGRGHSEDLADWVLDPLTRRNTEGRHTILLWNH